MKICSKTNYNISLAISIKAKSFINSESRQKIFAIKLSQNAFRFISNCIYLIFLKNKIRLMICNIFLNREKLH